MILESYVKPFQEVRLDFFLAYAVDRMENVKIFQNLIEAKADVSNEIAEQYYTNIVDLYGLDTRNYRYIDIEQYILKYWMLEKVSMFNRWRKGEYNFELIPENRLQLNLRTFSKWNTQSTLSLLYNTEESLRNLKTIIRIAANELERSSPCTEKLLKHQYDLALDQYTKNLRIKSAYDTIYAKHYISAAIKHYKQIDLTALENEPEEDWDIAKLNYHKFFYETEANSHFAKQAIAAKKILLSDSDSIVYSRSKV